MLNPNATKLNEKNHYIDAIACEADVMLHDAYPAAKRRYDQSNTDGLNYNEKVALFSELIWREIQEENKRVNRRINFLELTDILNTDWEQQAKEHLGLVVDQSEAPF